MQNFNHSPYPFTDYDQINISYGHQGLPFPTWNYPPPPPPPPPSAPSSGSSWSTNFSPNMTSLHHPSSLGDPHATFSSSSSSPYSSSSAATTNVIPKFELDDAFANSFGDFSSFSSPSPPNSHHSHHQHHQHHQHHPHSHSLHTHHYPHHHHHHHHHSSAGTGASASVTPTLHHTSSLLQQTALLDHQPASTTLSSSSSPSTTSWKTSVASSTLGKTRTRDKYRVVYSEKQRVELEKEFYTSKYITIKRKAELAACLSLTERQVKIWFQNRRAKDRKIQKKKEQQNFCFN